jgi:hypothetical protein
MIERFGAERLLNQLRGELAVEDSFGKPWRCCLNGREHIAFVGVENGTVEGEGHRRRYYLRVPPTVITAQEAGAWTYGLRAGDYDFVVRSGNFLPSTAKNARRRMRALIAAYAPQVA